jgi:hypothetical protein
MAFGGEVWSYLFEECYRQGIHKIENSGFQLVGLRVKDLLQNVTHQAKHTVRVSTILRAAIVAVLIAAIEAFAEVVAVLIQINVITIVTVGCILICVRIFIAEARTILSVGLSGANALPIAVVHSLPEHIHTILIRPVVSTATRVTIARR